MKIGDKVRFLSEVGGGIISGFKGKDIVLVEDEDGFEIPTPIKDVVLVGNEDISLAKINRNEKEIREREDGNHRSIKARLSEDPESTSPISEETDIVESDESSLPNRKLAVGNVLASYLAFLANPLKEGVFSSYLVNQSNYCLHYVYAIKSEKNWCCKSEGEIEPNSKLFIEEFTYTDLNSLQEANIQLIAFKRNGNFELKPASDVRVRIDATKFYKLNSFKENDFFEQPALLYSIIDSERLTKQEENFASDILDTLHKQHSEIIDLQAIRTGKEIEKRHTNHQSKRQLTKQLLKNDKIVVDLHANELLDTITGMSAKDILDYQLHTFQTILEQYKHKNGQKIVFIHGKGNGVLRHSLIHVLNYKYKKYKYQDASFQEYGYGATQVTIIT